MPDLQLGETDINMWKKIELLLFTSANSLNHDTYRGKDEQKCQVFATICIHIHVHLDTY